MNFQRHFVVLESTALFPAEGTPAANAGTATGTPPAVPPPAEQGGGEAGGWFGPVTILMYAAVFGAVYFLLIRPQKKRDKAVREMQASLKVGENIVTTGGLYGTIISIGEDCFVVEFGTNKGIRVPVRKSDVLAVKEPVLKPAKEAAAK